MNQKWSIFDFFMQKKSKKKETVKNNKRNANDNVRWTSTSQSIWVNLSVIDCDRYIRTTKVEVFENDPFQRKQYIDV